MEGFVMVRARFVFIILLGFFLLASHAAWATLDDGLVAYYSFDGNAADQSGRGNDGQISGASFTADRFGRPQSALEFNGVNSFVRVESSDSLSSIEAGDAVTVTAWINIHDWYQHWNVFNVVDKYNEQSDWGWEFSAFAQWSPSLGGFGAVGIGCPWSPQFDKWYHVAMTYDRAAGEFKTYADGILLCTVPYAGEIPDSAMGPLFIGASPTGPEEYSDGLIDDVRLYNRALSADDIASIYRNDLPSPPANVHYSWTPASPTSTPLNGRLEHNMVYDSRRGTVLLFGGGDVVTHQLMNDMWEWNPNTHTWTLLEPTGVERPIPRSNFGMAYDEARDKVVIMGGYVSAEYSNVGFAGDTWEWDCATHSWAYKPASSILYAGLRGAELAYDPNLGRVVLYGGVPYWVLCPNGASYAWDGIDWRMVADWNASPPNRAIGAMVTDTARSRLVAFGGESWCYPEFNHFGFPRDTWEWDGSHWADTSPSELPPAATVTAATFDSSRNVVVGLVGGEMWEWNGTEWTQRASCPAPPVADVSGGAASGRIIYTPSTHEFLAFGANGTFIGTLVPDEGPPVTIHVPAPIDEISVDGGPVIVTYDASASAGETALPTSCSPASGSYFAIGTTTVTCTATPLCGTKATAQFTVTVQTVPPTITVSPDVTVEATGPSTPVFYPDPVARNWRGTLLPASCDPSSGSAFGVGDTLVTCSTSCAWGTASANFYVHVLDTTPPQLVVPLDVNLDGQQPGGATVAYAVSSTDAVDGIVVVSCSPTSGSFFIFGTTNVTCSASDNHGNVSTSSFMVNVRATTPLVTGVSGPTTPQALTESVTMDGSFSDEGSGDTHSAMVDWGDGTTAPASVTETLGSGTVSASHIYAAAGVYVITLMVTDNTALSGSGAYRYAVVYDPIGGFVSGAGWIDSPTGAYAMNPSLTGKATFGFVSKYESGAKLPTGQTEFNFQVASFRFKSKAYEWLVVSGAKAQYKGVGTVNGSGDYGFLLTATDGQINGGGGVDRLRVKIWERATGQIVYDNVAGMVDDITAFTPQAIGAGSIVIHK